MSHAVHVEAARRLLDRFYRELVRGATVGHAVAEGRKALNASRARWIEYGPMGRTVELRDWFLPQLYQRAADDTFVPPDVIAPQQVRELDLFLSHQHNDSDRVEALARQLVEKHGLRVWLDKWECRPGKLKSQCEMGIRDSRFTVVVGSKTALKSKWVQWEIRKHNSFNPKGGRLLPIKFEKLDLPPKLDELLWVDFTDPAQDAANAARLAKLIRSTDAEDARFSRGFRSPARKRDESGPFPSPPQYGFHGRARELHHLERLFRSHRGIVLHAMGGMGKTALATEAAHWWTRSGLFRDGACFMSFEQFASADRVVQVLGTYLEGPMFDQIPAAGQRRRVLEVFRERDVLIVWDNFESALPQFNVAPDQDNPYTAVERKLLSELFEDLTTGAGKGRLLVTCRPGHTGFPGALPYELHGLARPDSLWLLSNILKRDGISIGEGHLTRERIDLLLNDLADHPLSLELVGPHLRTLTPEAIRADFTKLLKKFEQDAPEGRNQSLFASLEFSRKHLSSAARDALPWLGLFRGGVFEDNLLDVSQLTPEAWEPICSELEGIALVRKEEDISINGRPFLRFHPTLAFASTDSALAETPGVRERFIGVYLAFMRMLDRMLDGSQSRAALEILTREGANYRTAVHWAVIDRKLQAAATLGHTFHNFLKRSNRLRECDAWVRFLRDATARQGFTEEAADYEREHALTQYAQGDPKGAVEQIQALVERLRRTTEFDPTFQLALAIRDWGKMLDEAGASIQAVPILQEAVGRWEKLVERAGGRSWKALLDAEHYANAKAELGNLSTAMSYLAYALMGVRGLDEALAIAEAALEITQKLGHQKNISSGHIQCANILMDAGRYDEANVRYKLALVAARDAGDRGLEGGILQNLGSLAYDRDQFDRAEHLCRKSLRVFQVAGDHRAIMRAYELLGRVELKAGRLAEARAWWKKSGELAKQLGDQRGLSSVAQNLGIVCQEEGEAARARGEEPAARRHFEEALRSVAESLEIEQSLGNKPGEAASLGQLAQIHLHIADLDAAEFHAQEARKICESLGLKEAWMAYGTLSEIAEARGDTKAAAEWDQKRGGLRLELYRRIRGGFPPEMIRSLHGLTIACARAGCGDGKFGHAEEAALAQLDELPAPFPDFVAFLRQIATGQPPSIPNGLPPELRQLLEAAEQAVGKGRP
jgi:tetratricopeptide (TPR) repeat protein